MKVFFMLLLLFSVVITHAQRAGTLDKSFGEGGFVRTDIYKYPFYSDGKASALQIDGKIIVGGNFFDPEVIRYFPDGNIDSSFGQEGIARVSLYASVASIVVQPDGKIVIAGVDWNKPLAGVYAARFTPDGKVDSSFGIYGVINLDYEDYADVNAIVLQADGKLVLTGGAGKDGQQILDSYSIVMRLKANGRIDSTFGGDGRIENSISSANIGVAIQPDGKIVTGGIYYFAFQPGYEYVVSRYNEDGTPDNTFGKEGNTTTSGLGLLANPESLLLQPDGKIVLSGYSASKQYLTSMTALRYSALGTLDSTFGEAGKVVIPFGENTSAVYKALLQNDGKIVLAGGTYADEQFSGGDYALCRIKSNGSLDSSFGTDGREMTVLRTLDYAKSALLQPDGKIILVGESSSKDGDTDDVLLVRYNGDSKKQVIIAKVKHWLQNHTITWNGLPDAIAYYAVEQSNTSTKGFTSIATVSGAGNLKEYSFTNSHLLAGTNYYRIKAVGVDGSVQYSEVVSVDNAAALYSLYPNPARDYIIVKGLQSDATSVITITDWNGIVKARSVSKGSNEYRFQVGNLYSGAYCVNITTGGKTAVVKWVKE